MLLNSKGLQILLALYSLNECSEKKYTRSIYFSASSTERIVPLALKSSITFLVVKDLIS